MKSSSCSISSFPLAQSANLALDQFKRLARISDSGLVGANLLYERAATLGLHPGARRSANGSCRLIQCADGILALNLPRDCDWELIPAWLGPWLDDVNVQPHEWKSLEQHCKPLKIDNLLTQGRELGLAIAQADKDSAQPDKLAQIKSFPPQCDVLLLPKRRTPLVVDLSSLWAGPLCSHLLQHAGCRVIKIEAHNRKDGARRGSPEFFNLLHQGKESMVFDFQSKADIHKLHNLLKQADIVIEGSRPRALKNLGIDAEQIIQSRPGLVWLSITGYGRYGDQGSRIGFGDDTAADAGLCQIMYEATGKYQFVGDAIADPLTGIHAALLAWKSYLNGGNELIAICLRDTVAYCMQQELSTDRKRVLHSCQQWKNHSHRLEQLIPKRALSTATLTKSL